MCLARERESAEKLFSAKARQLLRALVIARLRRKWFLKRPPRASGEAARMIGGLVQQAERQTPSPPIFRAIMPSRDCSRSEVTFLVCRPSRTTPSIKHRAIFRAYFFEFAEAKRVTLMSSCGAEKLGRLNSSCGAERGRLMSSVLHTQIRLHTTTRGRVEPFDTSPARVVGHPWRSSFSTLRCDDHRRILFSAQPSICARDADLQKHLLTER